MWPKTLLTIIAITMSISVRAQMGKFFNTEKQLSSSFVNQVYFDREGFLWAATACSISVCMAPCRHGTVVHSIMSR